MLTYLKGNLLDTEAQALVNPVNCVGVMGAGLAKQFRLRYPKNFIEYQNYCQNGSLKPGGLFIYKEDGKVIINFATKNHWKNNSEYEYIENGLLNLAKELKENPISVAIPKLGCGLGGLDWQCVQTLSAWQKLECFEVYIYGENPR